MSHEPHTSISQEMLECIRECQTCNEVCLETMNHCLEMGRDHAHPEHINLMLDCAEICQTSANFMMRKSEIHPRVCELCAEICACCADDCDNFKDDPAMQNCATTCRSCAESCREMAQGS